MNPRPPTHPVTIAYLGGPVDGAARPWRRDTGEMPDVVDGYHLVGPHPYDAAVWQYAWRAERTGRRQPCRAGDERGCLGARCPSNRKHRATA